MRSIFKFKGRGGHKNRKYVGFWGDMDTNLMLTLACFSDGKSQSEILRELIDNWIQRKGGAAYFTKAIADRAYEVFVFRNIHEEVVEYEDFRDKLEEELKKGTRSGGVPKKYIDIILTKFDAKVKRANEKKSNY